MNPALLDTDILSEILKQRNSQILQSASNYLAEHGQFSISNFTRYEILRGLKEKSAARQIAVFEQFCQHAQVVEVSPRILNRAAELWVDARRGGHPCYDADLIIASTALEQNLTLVTGNVTHYQWIAGLALENWRSP